jgi:hypothetical protein
MRNLHLILLFFFGIGPSINGQNCFPEVDWAFTTSFDIIRVTPPNGFDCTSIGEEYPTITLMIGDEMYEFGYDGCTDDLAQYYYLVNNANINSRPEETNKIILPDYTCTYQANNQITDPPVGSLLSEESNRPIPTLSQWGLLILLIATCIIGVVLIRVRNRAIA